MTVGGLARLVRSWSYAAVPEAAGRRDLRLDLLRGFCVLVMVADHIGGEPSWLYAVTGGGRFLVSAAEGFVLLSGVTMGIVYGGLLLRSPFREALAKLLARVRLLYALTVILTLVFAGLSLLLGSPWTRDVTPDRPYRVVLGIITLHRSYSLTDVLLLYTFLVLYAAPMLWLLSRGHAVAVLAGSWTLWALWQAWPQRVQFPWQITDGGFPLPAWQAIFVTGLVLGFHRGAIARVVGRRRAVVFVLGAAITAAMVAVVASGALAALPFGDGQEWDPVFGKHHLRIGRLVALAAVSATAYGLASAAWLPLRRLLGWLLLPLGQHALSAYGIHLFVVALAASQLADPLRGLGQHAWIQLLGIVIVWASLPALAWTVSLCRTLVPGAARSPALARAAR